MLILTRTDKQGKNVIRIGDDITIAFLNIKGGGARVGITAPKGTSILRGELDKREKDDE